MLRREKNKSLLLLFFRKEGLSSELTAASADLRDEAAEPGLGGVGGGSAVPGQADIVAG